MTDRLLVVIPAWVLGDGTVAPPSCGDRVSYHLAFSEHDAGDDPDPTARELTADANNYAGPWSRRDHTGVVRTTWPTTLQGRGWGAHWSAPRELHGLQQLTGALVVDPLLSSQPATRGTVTHLHVISVEVQPRSNGPRGTVPGSHHLQPVWSSPRWFDAGTTTAPTRSGWHSYTELEPDGRYRRQTGTLATLALDHDGDHRSDGHPDRGR